MASSRTLLFAAFILANSAAAQDCGCKPLQSVLSAYQFATAVFSGTVEEISDIKPPKGVTIEPGAVQEIVFEVDRIWKGPRTRRITLTRVNSVSSECNYPFKKGESFLVFADKTSGDVYRKKYVAPGKEILDATICGRTRRLEESEADIKALGGGRLPEE